MDMPTVEASQCVEETAPNVPLSSGRVVNVMAVPQFAPMILDMDCRQDGALAEYYIQDSPLNAQFDANATFLYTARSSCNEIVPFTSPAEVAS
jgi:hypothetical protein